MASSKTLVYYFVPEDGDIPSEPNAFPIPKSPVTLGDLRAYFPMPGEYQFRSKYLYNGSQVWLDLTDDAATVPEFQNNIICKVTRMSWMSDNKPAVKSKGHVVVELPLEKKAPVEKKVDTDAGLDIFNGQDVASVSNGNTQKPWDPFQPAEISILNLEL